MTEAHETRRPRPGAVLAPDRSRPAAADEPRAESPCEVSVVMPCLNEAETVRTCVEKALSAFRELGVNGEVVVADNGSTDGSQAIATEAGARVVPVETPGYGSALAGGFRA